MTYSVHAFNHHTDLRKLSGSNEFNLQKRHVALLLELRRRGLQGVSRTAYGLFENSNVSEALKQANTFLVPGLRVLSANPCEGDMEVLAVVRNGASTSHILDLLKVFVQWVCV